MGFQRRKTLLRDLLAGSWRRELDGGSSSWTRELDAGSSSWTLEALLLAALGRRGYIGIDVRRACGGV